MTKVNDKEIDQLRAAGLSDSQVKAIASLVSGLMSQSAPARLISDETADPSTVSDMLNQFKQDQLEQDLGKQRSLTVLAIVALAFVVLAMN